MSAAEESCLAITRVYHTGGGGISNRDCETYSGTEQRKFPMGMGVLASRPLLASHDVTK